MADEPLTREQMLEARLNSLERRMEQLENWTGADEDGNWSGKEVDVAEKLLAQDMIVAHVLQHLQFLHPDFSIEKVRKGLHMALESSHDGVDDEMLVRWKRIIDECLPAPEPQAPDRRRNRSRPILVPKDPDVDGDGD